MAPTNDGAHLSSPLFAICKTDPDSQQRNPKFKIVHSDLVQELLSFEVHITKPYGSQSCRATTASIGSSSMSCTFCSLWRRPEAWRRRGASFDHLIRAREQGRWNGNTNSPCGLKIDDQFELGRLDDGQLAGFFAFQHAAGVDTSLPISI